MSTTTRRHLRRTGAAAGLTGLLALAVPAVLVLGAAPAAADSTTPQTVAFDLGDLDESGTGTFDQFDPALGTLTGVTITGEVSMDFDVCATNLSKTATSVPSGTVSGEAVLTFAGGVVVTAEDSMPVPVLNLAASDGGDDCAAFVESGTPPASPDSALISDSGVVDSFSSTLTDEAALAPYVGTGTVDFDWSPSSASDLNQPSEWTIAFLAGGEGEATIVYEYTTSENPPPPETTEPSKGVGGIQATSGAGGAGITPQAPTVAVGAPPAALPDTGGPYDWLVVLAGLLLMTGGGLIALRRTGSDAS